ncbi:hypothetical protein RFI_35303, partial [Reticulomyxa filosa]
DADNAEQDDDDDDDDAWDDMTIDSFLKLAKLGMELNEFDNVLKIVYGVLQCDDNVGEAWALGSLAHYRLGRFEDASIWLENANAVTIFYFYFYFFYYYIYILESEENPSLEETLATIREAMDVEKLPDVASLNLNEVKKDAMQDEEEVGDGDGDEDDEDGKEEENDNEEDDINAFVEDNDNAEPHKSIFENDDDDEEEEEENEDIVEQSEKDWIEAD